jgi:hypothetical protein
MNRVGKFDTGTPQKKLVVVFYFGDCGKWDFNDLAIGTFNFDTRSGQGLGGFHAPNCAAHTPAVARYNFDIIFAVEQLECS